MLDIVSLIAYSTIITLGLLRVRSGSRDGASSLLSLARDTEDLKRVSQSERLQDGLQGAIFLHVLVFSLHGSGLRELCHSDLSEAAMHVAWCQALALFRGWVTAIRHGIDKTVVDFLCLTTKYTAAHWRTLTNKDIRVRSPSTKLCCILRKVLHHVEICEMYFYLREYDLYHEKHGKMLSVYGARYFRLYCSRFSKSKTTSDRAGCSFHSLCSESWLHQHVAGCRDLTGWVWEGSSAQEAQGHPGSKVRAPSMGMGTRFRFWCIF